MDIAASAVMKAELAYGDNQKDSLPPVIIYTKGINSFVVCCFIMYKLIQFFILLDRTILVLSNNDRTLDLITFPFFVVDLT